MKERFLTKESSKVIQGVAILMMIYHHIFMDGNNWCINKGTSLLDLLNFINIGKGATFQLNFAWFCKICVALFAFVSGFGIYIQLDKKSNDKVSFKQMYKYCLKRLWSFYKVFIVCYLFFVGFSIAVGLIDDFFVSPINMILNLTGLSTEYNSILWYIPVYYLMVLISPLIYALLKKIDLKRIVTIVCAIFIVGLGIAFALKSGLAYLKVISGFIQIDTVSYLIIFMEGMFCGRYELMEFISSKLNLLTSFILLIATYILRTLLIRAPSDWFFDLIFTLPLVISLVNILKHFNKLSNVLAFIGKYSAYMWYAHPYFYAYLFYDFVIPCDASIVVYLQVVVYSLASGLVLSKVLKFIEESIKKLKIKKV